MLYIDLPTCLFCQPPFPPLTQCHVKCCNTDLLGVPILTICLIGKRLLSHLSLPGLIFVFLPHLAQAPIPQVTYLELVSLLPHPLLHTSLSNYHILLTFLVCEPAVPLVYTLLENRNCHMYLSTVTDRE